MVSKTFHILDLNSSFGYLNHETHLNQKFYMKTITGLLNSKIVTTVTHFFHGYLFLHFYNGGHFCCNLFSQTAKCIKIIFSIFGALVHESVCELSSFDNSV